MLILMIVGLVVISFSSIWLYLKRPLPGVEAFETGSGSPTPAIDRVAWYGLLAVPLALLALVVLLISRGRVCLLGPIMALVLMLVPIVLLEMHHHQAAYAPPKRKNAPKPKRSTPGDGDLFFDTD